MEPVKPEHYGSLIIDSLPNLICLPHMCVHIASPGRTRRHSDRPAVVCRSGSSTHETTEQTCTAAVDQLADYLDGKGARNRVI